MINTAILSLNYQQNVVKFGGSDFEKTKKQKTNSSKASYGPRAVV